MNKHFPLPACVRGILFCGLFWMTRALVGQVLSNAPASVPSDPQAVARVAVAEGLVELFLEGSDQPIRVTQGQELRPGNRLRTGPSSRAVVRFSDQETMPMAPMSEIRIATPAGRKRGFEALRGLFKIFHRDRPEDFGVRTPRGGLIVRGTEVVLEVEDGGSTRVSVLDGKVELTTPHGTAELSTGEAALLEVGRPPRPTPMLEARSLVQWRLYYPALLDPSELDVTDASWGSLQPSLSAYREGDIQSALEASRIAAVTPKNAVQELYATALHLSVGQVSEAEARLNEWSGRPNIEPNVREMASALRLLIVAVRGEKTGAIELSSPAGASLRLAQSYAAQSRGDLRTALAAARMAVAQSPEFGFGWVRVAELEFSFGRISASQRALERGLARVPRHAQAWALRGFLLAAEGATTKALAEFEHAILLDGALGNAWLGRGLCRIRQGDVDGGRNDLQMAATLEPSRAVLRSYLGKAFAETGDSARARHELELARRWDQNDPTPWLYSALLRQSENEINQAVVELEHAQALNTNRLVYRSRLLLDQDAAVQGANLATIFRDNNMVDVGRREAARAVNSDYANAPAHQFLADTYNELRDPRQVNLRYEAPWLSEYLVANLLSSAGAGTLSPFVTEQEYSRLFERNRLGLVSATDYSSQGDWTQSAVQYGMWNQMAYALEGLYRFETGHRPNNDLDQLTTSLKLKDDFSPRDSLFLQATYYRAETGDVRPYYDESQANPGLRTHETQEPLLVVGERHRWAPGIDTLFLGGRLQDEFRVGNPGQQLLTVQRDSAGVRGVAAVAGNGNYRSDLEVYSAELQQIVQQAPHTLIVGARYATGEFQARNADTIYDGGPVPPSEFDPAHLHQAPDAALHRVSAYGYYGLQVIESLWLLGGINYSRLTQPRNVRLAPLADGTMTTDLVSPKAGVIWTPRRGTTVRGAYTRSLGGLTFEESFRLEPAQVAGFIQNYRSLIPEALPGVGAVGGTRFDTVGLGLDQQFGARTYAGLSAELLQSEVSRVYGTYDDQATGTYVKSTTPQRLDYWEPALALHFNRLLGDEWSVGASYRVSRARLETRLTEIPLTEYSLARTDEEATLHEARIFALYTHASGFFGLCEAIALAQQNNSAQPSFDWSGDNFWHVDVWGGYRLPGRWAELRLGVLNLTGRDYRLHPLNLTVERPHERTFVASLRFAL